MNILLVLYDAIIENWNQDQPENKSNFSWLYIKGQMLDTQKNA